MFYLKIVFSNKIFNFFININLDNILVNFEIWKKYIKYISLILKYLYQKNSNSY